MYNNKKSNTCKFIKKSKDIHGDKYEYSLVEYVNNKKKVKIICKYHGVFDQAPVKHLFRGNGCPKCASEKRGIKLRLSKKDFIDRSNKSHDYKYNYSLVDYNTSCDYKKIKILCPLHGIFEQQPSSHMNGCGCPKCANEKNHIDKLSNTDDFISKSIRIHKNKYEYSLVDYTNAHNKVKIICKNHGLFEQSANSHLNGNGCPMCRISKGEEKIISFLDTNNIIYKKEYKFKDCKYKQVLKFDFYLPEYNMCIEYDGEQHFKKYHKWENNDSKLTIRQIRDQIKTNYCENNDIRLLRIPYTELKNIDFLLTEKLKNNI